MINAILPFELAGNHYRCEMRYDEKDPFAVSFIFRQPCEEGDCQDTHEMKWIVGRDLMAEGLDSESWVGEGDVKLRRDSHGSVSVSLDSHEGKATITVPRRPLKDFIKRSYTIVDAGKEAERFNWEEFDQERASW